MRPSDPQAAISAITIRVDQWREVPMTIGYVLVTLLMLVGHFSPSRAEMLSAYFSFLALAFRTLLTPGLAVRYGDFSSQFYQNSLALIFFTTCISVVLFAISVCLKYRQRPARFIEYVLERLAKRVSFFSLAVTNILAATFVYAGTYLIALLFGVSRSNYQTAKPLTAFFVYCIISSGSILIASIPIPFLISSIFYLLEKSKK